MSHRVAVYGGTELANDLARFVRHLGRAVVARSQLILVTGGFRHPPAHPEWISTDWCAVEGAAEFLAERGQDQRGHIETWLPARRLDRKDVVRFERGTTRMIRAGTAQARRFALVRDVDALITVKGKKNTAQVLDLALAIGRPALPLPFTGPAADSAVYWQENRAQIRAWFEITDAEVAMLETADVRALDDEGTAALAERIVDLVWRGVERYCLVLMPFDHEATSFFSEVLEDTVRTAGCTIVRIDLEPEGGDVFKKFLDHLGRADAVVADITDYNPNVMYELGHVHANGHRPFLYHRGSLGDQAADQLPFYLKGQGIAASDVSRPAGRSLLASRLGAFLEREAMGWATVRGAHWSLTVGEGESSLMRSETGEG